MSTKHDLVCELKCQNRTNKALPDYITLHYNDIYLRLD